MALYWFELSRFRLCLMMWMGLVVGLVGMLMRSLSCFRCMVLVVVVVLGVGALLRVVVMLGMMTLEVLVQANVMGCDLPLMDRRVVMRPSNIDSLRIMVSSSGMSRSVV